MKKMQQDQKAMDKIEELEKAVIATLTEEAVEWLEKNQEASNKEFEQK